VVEPNTMTERRPFDLDAYLERIDYHGALVPSLATLEGLHLAHLAEIPFENIDVRLGRPIELGIEALQAKLIRGRRGGYCFEQNTVFAAALGALGFEVATLEARVRPPGETRTLARTHMVLRVDLDGRAWIADVGFGATGPLMPVPLDGTPSEQSDGTYRIESESETTLVLRRSTRGTWHDLYAVTLVPALPVDFMLANYYTSTHPRSRFVLTLTVQQSRAEARQILRGRTYTIVRGGEETEHEITADELPALLEEAFGLKIPEDDALRALGD